MVPLIDFEKHKLPQTDEGNPVVYTTFYVSTHWDKPGLPPKAAEIFVRLPEWFTCGDFSFVGEKEYSGVGLTSAPMDEMLRDFMHYCDDKTAAELLRDTFAQFANQLDEYIKTEDWSST